MKVYIDIWIFLMLKENIDIDIHQSTTTKAKKCENENKTIDKTMKTIRVEKKRMANHYQSNFFQLKNIKQKVVA